MKLPFYETARALRSSAREFRALVDIPILTLLFHSVHSASTVPRPLPCTPHHDLCIPHPRHRPLRIHSVPVLQPPKGLSPKHQRNSHYLGQARRVHSLHVQHHRWQDAPIAPHHLWMVGIQPTRKLPGGSDAQLGDVCDVWIHTFPAMELLLLHGDVTAASTA